MNVCLKNRRRIYKQSLVGKSWCSLDKLAALNVTFEGIQINLHVKDVQQALPLIDVGVHNTGLVGAFNSSVTLGNQI